MKRILIILLLIIPFIGFGQIDSIQTYHDNGKLRSIGVLKDGKNEGLWKFYNQDGFLKQSINYKNGLFNGLWINYRRNKNNVIEIDESIYINGRREGIWKHHIDNSLIQEGYLKNKMRQRIWKYYHDNGQLKKETKWKDDKEIYSRYWDKNGNEIDKEIYYESFVVNRNRVDKKIK